MLKFCQNQKVKFNTGMNRYKKLYQQSCNLTFPSPTTKHYIFSKKVNNVKKNKGGRIKQEDDKKMR